MPFLSVSMNSRHGLKIGGGIPVYVKEDKTTGAGEIESCASSFGGEKECETFPCRGAVEIIYE
jgi:hypothetical protein